MQSFGTVTPITVKAPNLVQMRLISYRSVIELVVCRDFRIFGRISICPFNTKGFDRTGKNCQNIFFQSYLFEKQILQLKRAQKLNQNDI